MRQLLLVYAVLLVGRWKCVNSFSHAGLTTFTCRRLVNTIRAAEPDTAELQEAIINGSGPEVIGKLVTAQDAKSQLFSAFAALDLTDQYDAVLTGLCAKILDSAKTEDVASRMLDPMQLLQEMNEKRIAASPRSIMALIDASVKAQDAKLMARVISWSVQNVGGLRQFGSSTAAVLALPPTPTSRVKCSDGQRRTRAERLALVTNVPVDERGKEITNALAVASVAAACGLTDVVGPHELEPYANTVLSALTAVGVVDNFYDILKTSSNFAIRQMNKNNEDNASVQLPDKEKLPLGLGTGQISGTVVRGLLRLLTLDAERESQCEAAALVAAYELGLPCFAYRPNALEASVLVVESLTDDELDNLLTANGIMRMLVWLLAPVAMESSKHPVCVMSNPKEASSFLDRLEEYASSNSNILSGGEIFWSEPSERDDLLKWAYTEADLLLRDCRKQVVEVTNRLVGGAATIGDCIAVLEGW